MDSIEVLNQNLTVCGGFTPLNRAGMDALRKWCAAEAADCRFGRKVHEFPEVEELPGLIQTGELGSSTGNLGNSLRKKPRSRVISRFA